MVMYGEEKKFFTADFTDDRDSKNGRIEESILNLRASVSICGSFLLSVVSSSGGCA